MWRGVVGCDGVSWDGMGWGVNFWGGNFWCVNFWGVNFFSVNFWGFKLTSQKLIHGPSWPLLNILFFFGSRASLRTGSNALRSGAIPGLGRNGLWTGSVWLVRPPPVGTRTSHTDPGRSGSSATDGPGGQAPDGRRRGP